MTLAASAPGRQAQQSTRILTLRLGELELELPVPQDLWPTAESVRTAFVNGHVAEASDQQTTLELLTDFMRFALRFQTADATLHMSILPLVRLLFLHLRQEYLKDNDIHAIAHDLGLDEDRQAAILSTYYDAHTTLRAASLLYAEECLPAKSALFNAARRKKASIMVLFGGQGNVDDYFSELTRLYNTYGQLLQPLFDRLVESLQAQVNTPEARSAGFYSRGFDIMQWIRHPESRPPLQYLVSGPISMPLIGLTQLLAYWTMLRVLQKSPADVRTCLKGATGHSQGLISAIAIASSSDEDDFADHCDRAVKLLFWMGLRCQQAYPPTTLNPKVLQDSLVNGEGEPTPMLAINNLPHHVVRDHVEATNKHLPAERQIRVALLNGPRSVIVSGAPQSLYGLNVALRKLKARSGADQSRVPFSKRDVRFSTRYLPVSVPFHSSYLDSVRTAIEQDIVRLDLVFRAEDLLLSVFATDDGRDIKSVDGALKPIELTLNIVEQVSSKPVLWEKATATECTHMLDFGPGGSSGIGALTSRNKDGSGVQIILASALSSLSKSLLDKSIVFNADEGLVRYAQNWSEEFAPKLVRTAHDGRIMVDTRWTRIMGKPPLMVAGMTPSSVHEDFVAATINAGYHGELAGGGLYTENALRDKLEKIMALIDPGEGITLNALFLNARQWGFQYPLVQVMRREGYPIDGLCVAAGVPSLENANEIIHNLIAAGIKHVAFKPGSTESIRQVIAIAEANPTVPIIMQWTGGRAGGHHSFEDFHQPLLETYGAIRKQRNILLVAGSGFGDAVGTLPYLTGEWSVSRDYPSMPFDAILFASRLMVAKEGKASSGCKELIVEAEGIDDERKWEDSYSKPTGGIITVKSELGEPIHKIATRGVLLWKELDDTVFNLSKEKRKEVIMAKKDYLIKRLNADAQKVWFGAKSDNVPCDLQDMTYEEVAYRLVKLCWIAHQKRWIDKSYRLLLADFLWRVEERFSRDVKIAFLQSLDQFGDNPSGFLTTFFAQYPQASRQLLTSEDVLHFLSLCGRRGQKPVPFVPILDEHFETWFKKDSLWQSEDLDAVADQDPQRVCILQGPVAAKYSKSTDESVKQILDGIHTRHVELLLERSYGGDHSKVPIIPYLSSAQSTTTLPPSDTLARGITLVKNISTRWSRAYDVSPKGDALPALDDWLKVLAGTQPTWLNALLLSKFVVRGKMIVDSPLHDLFRPRPGQRAIVTLQNDGKDGEKPVSLAIYDSAMMRGARVLGQTNEAPALEVLFDASTKLITVNMYERKDSNAIALPLLFRFQPQQGYALIHEIMEGRNDRIKAFYWHLWFDEDISKSSLANPNLPLESVFETSFEISRQDISEFCRTVGNQAEIYVDSGQKKLAAPMDFAIVAGWRAVIKGIFPSFINGDLLKLVHLSNSFRMLNNAMLLEEGDSLRCRASINSIVNSESGKTVEVKGCISRDGKDILEVVSQFFYRGKFDKDFEFTFRKRDEVPMQVTLKTDKDIAVLKSKEWIQLEERATSLLVPGAVITVRLQSHERFKNMKVFSSVETSGSITIETSTKEVIQIGQVNFECGECHGNPVTAYLARVGVPVEQAVPFPNERPSIVPDPSVAASAFTAPSSNETYAQISGDLNPIHVNPYFADLAQLPTTITHGMWTSAATRRLVEIFAADNQPQRVTAYNATFLNMVSPGDQLQTKLYHVGMRNGKKIVRVETMNQNNEKVLEGTAEIDQPATAYVFTGQGSQEKGMGMDLYSTSSVARAIWDRADQHFIRSYGFSILDIVRNNPKEVMVHFGGPKGARIRQNYRSMTYDIARADGSGVDTLPLFPTITDATESYTFRQPTGLLNATQFTQPALTLLQKAAFEDMLSKGLVQQGCAFAGHSLGEYAALASIGNVLPIEALVDVVFYRGMTMQSAVPRDASGRSDYAMCAVNPSRVGPTFGEQPLKFVVDVIQRVSGQLLEIVNYNVEHWQYVVSGNLANLETLTEVLNDLRARKVDFAKLTSSTPLSEVKRQLEVIINAQRDKVLERKAELELAKKPFELTRGEATIPLPGIDVPFHSRFLLSGVAPFRAYLSQRINPANVDVALLVGKYIPNLVALPFRLDREYVKMVYDTCTSPKLAKILRRWPANSEEAEHMRAAAETAAANIFPKSTHGPFDDSDSSLFEPNTPAKQQQLGYTLLVELLAYQFASPVRWIETQDQLFKTFQIERLVEIGPGPTLANMAQRTLKFKYEAYDEAMTFRRELLCYTRDKAIVYYEDTGSSAPMADAPAASGASTAASSSMKLKAAAVSSAPAPVASPAPAAATPPPRPIVGAVAVPVSDAPVTAKEILHVLVAQKLKKPLGEVPLTKSIKELSGGKSTLQNELLGDLQKEFGEVSVEKPEEAPLIELAQSLQAQGGIKGGAPLGKITTNLVSKMLGSKLPGGYGPAQVRAYLTGDYGLGTQRVEGCLLHALTMEPATRLGSDGEARTWLDSAVISYSSYVGVSISKGGSGAAAGGAPVAVAQSAAAAGTVTSVPDLPISAIQFLRVIVAAKIKKTVSEIPPASTLKAISAGKSTLQNELLGDIQKEFGGDGSGLGDNAAEQALSDLASSPAGLAYTRLGPVSQAQINRIISSKMPAGVGAGALRTHLATRWGLGSGRQDGVLLHTISMEPPSRFNSETDALAWLDSAAQDYATINSVSLGGGGATGGAAAGGAVAGAAVVDSAAVTRLQLRQDAFVREQMELFATYVGHDLLEGHRLFEKTVAERDNLQAEMDRFVSEHGAAYIEGIKPQFDPRKTRRYDSYWNWSRQEAMVLFFDIVFGRLTDTNIDRSIMQRCIDLMNRADPILVETFDYYMAHVKLVSESGVSPNPDIPLSNYDVAYQLGTTLADNVREAMKEVPHAKDVSVPTAPNTEITANGQLLYREVPRPSIRKLESYVREMRRGGSASLTISPTPDHVVAARKAVRRMHRILLSRTGDKRQTMRVRQLLQDIQRTIELGQMITPPLHRGIATGAVRPGPVAIFGDNSTSSTANNSNGPRRKVNGKNGTATPSTNGNAVNGFGDRMPYLYLKTETSDGGWAFDRTTTSLYMEALTALATEGLSFVGKTALLTGCGRGSIGAEVLRGLLAGGAQVIVTTSSFSLKTTEYYRSVYERSGARGSALIIVPFNQASNEDTKALVDYIYDSRSGLGWDLDIIVPFAALSENGREISDIDGKSELAHRLMLTNLLRLLGTIKTQKESRHFDTRPAQVILPLSPNHGVFGGDGLYGESKAGLETLFNRWHSESWGPYLTIVGAVIGWTRGTGLMSANNIVAEALENLGVRTFSTQEMAFNLLGLMHPSITRLAQYSPVWADLNGGLDHVAELNRTLQTLRANITNTASVRQAIVRENDLDESVLRGPVSHSLRTIAPRANVQVAFPKLKSYEYLQAMVNPHLRELLDLSKVIVVTGYGEVGPWGNSRTRWEMEAFGEFSLEGCIEMAWIMGMIKHHNGSLKGQHYAGWMDVETGEPVKDTEVKSRYEKRILEHTGIRLIEPTLFEGYDPSKKTFLQQVAIDHDMAPVEVSKEEAEHFRLLHGDKVEVFEKTFGSGQWMVRLKKGATLYIPKALRFDRLVAGQIPTGWDARRYGLPEDIVRQVDPITLYVLVSTAEALLAAGITDPYELYKYVHVSEVGNTSGGGVGGMRANIRIYKDRLLDRPVQSDILQENFINTMPAWVNMLLLSSSGPIKTPVGACATAVESVDIGVETILSGKAKVVVVGGYDDFQEEGSYEFASMKATSSAVDEFARGREPKEMSRPAATSRAGFMEAQGAGMQVLMPASLAIEVGVPIYGVIAHTATATDKEGRSVPAPGQGILTTAREAHIHKQLAHPSGAATSGSTSVPSSRSITPPPSASAAPITSPPTRASLPSVLDIKYRVRQIRLQRKRITEWIATEQRFLAEELEAMRTEDQMDESAINEYTQRRQSEIAREASRLEAAAKSLWGSDFYRQDPRISPLRGALAVFGLTMDDIGVASFHGTGTQANDVNESEVLNVQMAHLGRSRGNPLPAVMQKYLTGHPKGAAAAWMLNGVLQSLDSGLIPGNRNADNIDAKLRSFDFVYYPSRTIQTDVIRAGLLKSFGFGQVGGEVLVVHPDYVLACLDENQYTAYVQKRALRQDNVYRHLHDALTAIAPMIRVKNKAPYTDGNQRKVYLNPLARAVFDSKSGEWVINGDTPASVLANVHQPLMASPEEQMQLYQALTALPETHSSSSSTAGVAINNKGIGIDIELVTAIDIHNDTFIKRNFTPREIAYCRSAPDPRASFTGRWCAKEAAIKAVCSRAPNEAQLWKGGAGAPLVDIEVVPASNGAPTFLFHGAAQEVLQKAGVTSVTVSISHSGSYAMAMASAV